ncbi:MAG: hypothetical protein ACRYG5_17360 [Janthinobacterium lividum]
MQRLILPFIAGFLATVFFQQSAVGLLHVADLSTLSAYSTAPLPPTGLPSFIVDALYGGVWSVLMTWLLRVSPQRPMPWIGACVFGGVAVTAVSIFLIGPLQGSWPSGNILPRVTFGLTINAVWGWGVLVFLRAFTPSLESEASNA